MDTQYFVEWLLGVFMQSCKLFLKSQIYNNRNVTVSFNEQVLRKSVTFEIVICVTKGYNTCV